MPLTVNITRGHTFVSNVPFTIADLNAAALPNITIAGSVGASDLEDGAVTKAKVAPDAYFYAAAGGTANTYTATLSPAPTALVTGMTCRLSFTTANTGASTLNLNSLGASAIRKRDRQPLEAGDIAQYAVHELVWDGTYWILQTEGLAPRKFFPTATGTTNAYEVALGGYTFNAYTDLAGFVFAFTANASNTAAATLNVNGKGAVALRRHDGSVLQSGDIALNAPVVVMFDGANFRALNVIAIATPPTAAIEVGTSEANGTATALATGTTVASGTLTLPAGKTWKAVRVTFTTWLDDSAGIENFILKNATLTVSAPSTARGSYITNNSDDATLVTVTWEWVPSGGAESASLSIDVVADKPGSAANGDQSGNRKLVIQGISQA